MGRKSSLYLDMMNLNMQKRQCLSVSAINLIKPVQLDELKEALEKITKKKEKYEEKVREKVRDQMALKALEFLSIPELAGHRKWREHFLDPVFDCHKEDNFIMAVLQIQNENGRNEKLDKEIEKHYKKRKWMLLLF